MTLDRRSLLALAGLAAAAPALAEAAPVPAPLHEGVTPPAKAPDQVWDVWPGRPPGGEAVAAWAKGATPPRPTFKPITTDYARPVLAVWRPKGPSKASLLILPGGGYRIVAWDKEAAAIAERYLPLGVTCFALAYRLPALHQGWANAPDAPLADAQRALRLVRADAVEHGRDGDDVGVVGFSAGGHLAGRVAMQPDLATYAPMDAKDQLSARPSYAGLIYPLVTLREPMLPARILPVIGFDGADTTAVSVETHVKAGDPPVFIVHAMNDTTVPVAHSFLLADTLQKARVPVEAHFFQEGEHGFALTLPKTAPAAAWGDLFSAWARRNGGMAAA